MSSSIVKSGNKSAAAKTRRRDNILIALVMRAPVLAKSECVGFDTRVQELDLESVVHYRSALTDKLVQPLLGHSALAAGIDVRAMARAGRFAIDLDEEADHLSVRRRTENEMQVAGMEFENDAAVFLIEHGMFGLDRPISTQAPFIQSWRAFCIGVRLIPRRAAWRDEVFRSFIADIRLGRPFAASIRRGLGARRLHQDNPRGDLLFTRLLQKRLYNPLGLLRNLLRRNDGDGCGLRHR